MADTKEQALEAGFKQIDKAFGKGSIMGLVDQADQEIEVSSWKKE